MVPFELYSFPIRDLTNLTFSTTHTKRGVRYLVEYPCLSFDQSSKSDFYLSEEALGDYDFGKIIKINHSFS